MSLACRVSRAGIETLTIFYTSYCYQQYEIFCSPTPLRFHVTTEHFRIADSYIYAINKEESIVVFSMATMFTQTRQNVSL
jgi:hypothetical protein